MTLLERTSIATASFLALIGFIAAPAGAQPGADTPAERILNASPPVIAADAELARFVESTAESTIAAHCARCHGDNLEGGPGVPNLVDYDWLWGITGFESNAVAPVMAIEATILYGVRNRNCPEDQLSYGACADTRYSEMPAYADVGLTDDQRHDVVEYLINLSGGDADDEAVARAESTWPLCTECHAEDGFGYPPYGGPNLTDDIWLYGGSREEIFDVVSKGRLGVCPPWANELDAATIKALAVYIYNKYTGG